MKLASKIAWISKSVVLNQKYSASIDSTILEVNALFIDEDKIDYLVNLVIEIIADS